MSGAPDGDSLSKQNLPQQRATAGLLIYDTPDKNAPYALFNA